MRVGHALVRSFILYGYWIYRIVPAFELALSYILSTSELASCWGGRIVYQSTVLSFSLALTYFLLFISSSTFLRCCSCTCNVVV